MAKQKITFAITNIDEVGPLELTVDKVQIQTKEGNKEVEKIFFCIPPSERGDIKNILASKKSDGTENKTFELEYDDEDLEAEKEETLFECSSKAGSEKHGPKPKALHKLNKKKELRIWELSLITLKVKGEDTQDNTSPGQPKQPSPKPKSPDQNQDPDQNKGPSNPTPKKQPDEPDKSPDKEDTPKPQEVPPKSSESTPEEVNNAKNKLKQARESGNKDDLVNALNETETITKNSSDQTLKKEKAETENKLGQVDKEELRNIIKEEVAKELKKFGIKAGDLSQESKQKLDELNNNNNNNNNEAGVKALDKLISKLEQEIKSGNENKIQEIVKQLKQFTEDKSDEYAQNAYVKRKVKVQELLEKANNQSSQNKEKERFFRPNNPLMWLSGIAIIGLVVGVVLIIRSRRKKLTVK